MYDLICVSGESFPAWFHDWPPSSYSAQTSSRRPTTMGSWMAWPFSSITLFSRPRPHDHRHIILLAPIPAYTLWNYTIVPCAINVWLNVFYVKVQGSASLILYAIQYTIPCHTKKKTRQGSIRLWNFFHTILYKEDQTFDLNRLAHADGDGMKILHCKFLDIQLASWNL